MARSDRALFAKMDSSDKAGQIRVGSYCLTLLGQHWKPYPVPVTSGSSTPGRSVVADRRQDAEDTPVGVTDGL